MILCRKGTKKAPIEYKRYFRLLTLLKTKSRNTDLHILAFPKEKI